MALRQSDNAANTLVTAWRAQVVKLTHHHDAATNCPLQAFSIAMMKDQSGLKTTMFAMSWLFSRSHPVVSQRRLPSQCTSLDCNLRNLCSMTITTYGSEHLLLSVQDMWTMATWKRACGDIFWLPMWGTWRDGMRGKKSTRSSRLTRGKTIYCSSLHLSFPSQFVIICCIVSTSGKSLSDTGFPRVTGYFPGHFRYSQLPCDALQHSWYSMVYYS